MQLSNTIQLDVQPNKKRKHIQAKLQLHSSINNRYLIKTNVIIKEEMF